MRKRTVLLAEDHHLVRAGMRALVDAQPGFAVVGEAGDGREALDLVAALAPDLLLLDLAMPGLGGLEVLARLPAAGRRTRVLVLSMHDEPALVLQVLRAGADGYLHKRAAALELQVALTALCAGQRYLSPAVAEPVIALALAAPPPLPADAAPAAAALPLTPRQREILRLLASGQSAKQIAYALGLSVKTVETHRAQLMDRLGIRDLPRLVLYAVRHGVVSLDAPPATDATDATDGAVGPDRTDGAASGGP